jgi:hypothetical protein
MAKRETTRLCPNCGRKLYRSDELRGRCKCGQALVSLVAGGEFDESPIAGDRDVGGKPDDFYDRGDDVHPDVW